MHEPSYLVYACISIYPLLFFPEFLKILTLIFIKVHAIIILAKQTISTHIHALFSKYAGILGSGLAMATHEVCNL